jgi:hypothetical protein
MTTRAHVIAGAIALAAITAFAISGASAQTEQQLNWCEGKDGATLDLQISGCTGYREQAREEAKQFSLKSGRKQLD